MKEKILFHRVLSSALAAIMVCGMLPVGAFAHEESGHTHTDACYSVGELLCQRAEEEGHAHDEDCYCQGGELTCEQEEAEGHTHGDACYEEVEREISEEVTERMLICDVDDEEHSHDESCYDEETTTVTSTVTERTLTCGEEESEGHVHDEECYYQGGELICGREETEGHTHDVACYARGDELICGQEETPDSSEEPEVPEEPAEPEEPGEPNEPEVPEEPEIPEVPEIPEEPEKGEYDSIKAMLMEDESIEFDPDTQTFLVIQSNHTQRKHLQELNIAETDDVIASKFLRYGVFFDEQDHDNWVYYTFTEGDSALKTYRAKDINWNTTDIEYMAVDLTTAQLGIVILPQGTDYTVYSDIDNYYYGYMTDGESDFGRERSYICYPTENRKRVEYTGTAGAEAIEVEFSFEWDLCVFMNFEIGVAEPTARNIDFPGYINGDEGIDGYIEFYVELRDEDGNIFPLPKTFYDNYDAGFANRNNIILMDEDGVISIELGAYQNGTAYYCPYGEFDFYLPVGYDYRVTLRNISIDSIGGFAYNYSYDVTYCEDGFRSGNNFTQEDRGQYWIYEMFLFMPCTRQIRVEKEISGDAEDDANYRFRAQQLIRTVQEVQYINCKGKDYYENLACYPYRLYDAATDTELPGVYKTDSGGTFTLKAGQYAIFDVWELPEDILEYSETAWMFIRLNIPSDIPDLDTESAHIFTELGSEDAATTIYYTSRNGDEMSIGGKTVDDVYGGDEILFLNCYGGESEALGGLTVLNQIHGSDGEQAFTFLVSASDEELSGEFGDMTFTNGVASFTLKDGESVTTENLPDGVTYEVTELEANQNGYETVATGTTGNIVGNETMQASFINVKKTSKPSKPTTPEAPETPDDPELPETPVVSETPDAPELPETPVVSDSPAVPVVTDAPAIPAPSEMPEGSEASADSETFESFEPISTPEEVVAIVTTPQATEPLHTAELDHVPQTGDIFPTAILAWSVSLSAVGIFLSLLLLKPTSKRKQHE